MHARHFPAMRLPGQMMAGRCTYGFYQIMGVTDCVASSIEHYIELAVKLGEGVA